MWIALIILAIVNVVLLVVVLLEYNFQIKTILKLLYMHKRWFFQFLFMNWLKGLWNYYQHMVYLKRKK